MISSRAEAEQLLNTPRMPSSEDITSSLTERTDGQLRVLATRSGIYLTLRYGLSIVVSMANMFLLTRWIGPHAYGVFVTAVGLTTFLASLTRFGVDTYLVRCAPAPKRSQYDVAFTLVLSNSLILTGVGIAGLPLLKSWYASEEFAAPYLVLMACVPLAGLAGIPVAKLERDLNFRSAASIELGGQVIALVVAAGLAWEGSGVWAPVAGMVAWQIFALLAACAAARFFPTLRIQGPEVREMLSFGFGFSASMRMWQLRSLVNPLLVGRFVGAEGVALVAFALRVAEGIGFIRTAAGRLAIAALTRLQSDRSQLKKTLEKAFEVQVVILGPLLCAFALCGPWLVPRLMGSRWTGLVAVYPLIAIGVLLSSVFNLQASALFVVGKQWSVLRAYACHVTLLGLVTFLLLPRLGILAYGWGEVLACAGYFFIHSALSRVIHISYRAVLPLLCVFVGVLGIATANLRGTTIWVVAIVSLVALGCSRASRGISPSVSSLNISQLPHSIYLRARTVLTKTRLRGWSYVWSLVRYGWGLCVYDSQRAIELGKNRVRHASARSFKRAGSSLNSMDGADSRGFHFGASEIPSIVQRVPIRLQMRAVEEADSVLMQRFCFRGHEVIFGDGVNWTWCPDGNLSWLWDLNRHRFFLTLATAHYYTSDHRYIFKLIELWRDWIKANPTGAGCNWRYPFEVAARLQNWMWAYFFLAYSNCTKLIDMQEFEHALHEHALYLYHHLEYHWPNNHLLLESKALYEFAELFPQFDTKERIYGHARNVLEQEVVKQVLLDGTHSELSSMYHRIVAGELEELLLLCERRGRSLPAQLKNRIQGMSRFSRTIVRADGSTPLLGDSATDDTYLRFDSGRREHSDLNFWLWRDPPDLHTGTTWSDDLDLQIFPHAGYAFLHSPNDTHVTFDFGAFSKCEASNHAHVDSLSFELWANGQQLIVDPGVYLPWQDRRGWTRYFRSTAAHNTVEIDEQEQSRLSESLDMRHTAHTRLLSQRRSKDQVAVTAECLPYRRNGREIRHTREIGLQPDRVKVRDSVTGAGVHRLTWSFQFSPDVELSYHNKLLTGLSSRGRKLFSLAIRTPQTARLRLFYGHKNPLRGWVSRNSAEVIPAPMACYSVCAELPFEMESTFLL